MRKQLESTSIGNKRVEALQTIDVLASQSIRPKMIKSQYKINKDIQILMLEQLKYKVADQNQWRYPEVLSNNFVLEIRVYSIKTKLMQIYHQIMNRIQMFQNTLTIGATKAALEAIKVKNDLIFPKLNVG